MFDTSSVLIQIYLIQIYLNKDWRCVEHKTSFLVQINCDWFAWCVVTAVALLSLLNDKCKLESLQRDGRPGWRFPQTAGCKARTCFVDFDQLFNTVSYIGILHCRCEEKTSISLVQIMKKRCDTDQKSKGSRHDTIKSPVKTSNLNL